MVVKLAELRLLSIRVRRELKRIKRRRMPQLYINEAYLNYKNAHAKFGTAIRIAKAKARDLLIQDLDRDPVTSGYVYFFSFSLSP